MSNLNNLLDESHEAVTIASKGPLSYVEAVAHYLANRRDSLVAEFEKCTEFQADAVSNRINALTELAAAGGSSVPKKKWARSKKPADDASKNVKVIDLSRVLTPPGWEEKVLPAYTALADTALEKIIQKEQVGYYLALLSEVRRFLRHLHTVDREAKTARALEERRMKGLGYG